MAHDNYGPNKPASSPSSNQSARLDEIVCSSDSLSPRILRLSFFSRPEISVQENLEPGAFSGTQGCWLVLRYGAMIRYCGIFSRNVLQSTVDMVLPMQYS